MPTEIFQLAVVIAANTHNPSILHPAFLRAERIVPPDWETKGNVISTPAISGFTYTNGIAISVEPAKLQVVDSRPPKDPRASKVPELARQYVTALPKVNYTAIGINLSAFWAQVNASEFLSARFLVDGPWKRAPLQPEGVEIRFLYRALDTQLRLSVGPETIQSAEMTGSARDGIGFHANYHRAVQQISDVYGALERFRDFCDHFDQLTETLMSTQVQPK
jgi:hypothetical protein